MTGTGLRHPSRPRAVSILGIIAVLQGDPAGTRRTHHTGANTFPMAIAGPLYPTNFLSFVRNSKQTIMYPFPCSNSGFIYILCNCCPDGTGSPCRYHYHGRYGNSMLVFAPTQLPLAIIEGVITVLIIMGLETHAKPELRTIGFLKEAK